MVSNLGKTIENIVKEGKTKGMKEGRRDRLLQNLKNYFTSSFPILPVWTV
ncbi:MULTISPECIES: hypothetical protein [Clostridium]|jgi:hypothetical protein|uniref:Resolvase/invertase-type recombinase catalytic domain-containing protein n=1 Tax=Clostridium lapidicellarium TaxID=3240931 RepID=A0ABV4E1M1_9CLOT|nr:hypothetical protein [uncultured Clostridium sp.]NLU08652.1 hypothetical protein [Clostridiales bacterium]